MPPEEYAELAVELGITNATLKGFFEIVEKKQVPPHELDSNFRQIATRCKELLAKYKTITSNDPAGKVLEEQVRVALEAGNFAKAEELLNQASDADVIAARQMQEQTNKRFVSAAESQAENGTSRKLN